jgi:endogenous inhibitor of DNA gyrase (YacG/DUF329 family)
MPCPICDRPTEKAWRPFCSKRCADRDLGKWLTGAYAIPAAEPDDQDELDEALQEAERKKPH